MPGKPHALGSQLVEMRGSQFSLSVAPEVSVSQIVGEDVDDVGWLLGTDGSRHDDKRRHPESEKRMHP